MTKPGWSHVLALSALSARKPQPRLQIFACKANSSPTELSLPKIPDCIRYITGAFCYNFKSQMNILASYYRSSLCQS